VTVEELKPLDHILKPDEHLGYFGFMLERLHATASGIELNPEVPENVRNQFTIARNA
jgi:hypothetical protein